ncbi:hypothetical protein [Phaeobacter inhibens]|uniref:Uncharacterized protein n=1 Tax=Phaeobacter inhibens TaxID=221822 RepID=A0A2I7KHB8_9RHOB|nr:hypothetical protein [Phaeobacter inhibens]AUR01964.1 hypothetical protein PhaeoP88_04652 [Phaeobacter inhibens]
MSQKLFKLVGGERVPMTPAEIQTHMVAQEAAQQALENQPEPEPEYAALTNVQYMALVQKAAPLTAEQFVEIMDASSDPDVKMVRLLLTMNSEPIHRDASLVSDGLGQLAAKGFLDEDGIARIKAAWPTV